MKKNCKPPATSGGGGVASFVHWRSGKRLFAKDYGFRCFPIGRRKK